TAAATTATTPPTATGVPTPARPPPRASASSPIWASSCTSRCWARSPRAEASSVVHRAGVDPGGQHLDQVGRDLGLLLGHLAGVDLDEQLGGCGVAGNDELHHPRVGLLL